MPEVHRLHQGHPVLLRTDQPHGDPLDLTQPEEALLRDVERFPLPVDGRLSLPATP